MADVGGEVTGSFVVQRAVCGGDRITKPVACARGSEKNAKYGRSALLYELQGPRARQQFFAFVN
jgi:hypothetical protein